MATHSSTLAWKIPWMERPGRLQSMRSLRVGHDWALHFHFSLSCIGEGNGNPLQCSCLENPRDEGAWWAAVYVVAQSRTLLKQLSSSSSNELSLNIYHNHLIYIKKKQKIKHSKFWIILVASKTLQIVHRQYRNCLITLRLKLFIP